MADEKRNIAQDEGDYVREKPKKRHCKRFWWVYLLVTVIIVVLVVCLV